MKDKKSIGVVIAIAILLLSITTTLGNFSPVSYAQVEQETDQTGAATTYDDVTDDEDSADKHVVETATQDETNANDTNQQETDQTGAQISSELGTPQQEGEDEIIQGIEQGALEKAGGENTTQAIEQGALEQAGGEDVTQAIEQGALEKAAGVDAIQQI